MRRHFAFGWLALAALSCGSLPTSARPAQSTVFPGTDWQEAAPESQGVDSAKLNDALNYLRANVGSNGTTEVVVVRHGYLIWKGSNIDRQHSTWSVTKSFTSTAFGLLLQDGKCTLDTLAKDHVAELAPQYGGVKLRHFATMTSGYDGEGGSYDSYEGRADANALVPPLPPLFVPGAEFRYWDEAMMQFGNALTRIAGEPLGNLLKRRVFDPIGLKTWTWLAANGVPNWTGGFSTTARELARFGHLFLNRGNWNGRQLVSASWVDQATSVQVPASMPHDPLPRSEGSGVYGYNWWVNGIRPEGTREWPGAPPRTFAAWGFNNNMCFVVPEWNMVVVRMGTDGSVDRSIWSAFFQKLSAAIGTTSTSQSVTGFTLVNADIDQDLGPLSNGATLNLATLPTRNLNVRANTSPSVVGSVRFGYDGNSSYRIENAAPYALAGDSSGNYAPWTPALGSHTLSATPYSSSGAAGAAGTPLTVGFTVVDQASSPEQAVTGFTLVNADTDQDLGPLSNGATLNLATLPTRNLNVRANTSPSVVGSVRFGYDGNANYRVENAAPYALAGDSAGNYAPWTPAPGSHSVSATPYSSSGGTGAAGAALTVGFTVTDVAGAEPLQAGAGDPPDGDSDGNACGALGIEFLALLLLGYRKPMRTGTCLIWRARRS